LDNKLSYATRLRRTTSEDLKNYWSAHRIWATFVSLAATSLPLVVQIARHGASSISNFVETVTSTVAGLLVSVGGNYLISTWRAAKALDSEAHNEIGELRKRIELLKPPQRSPSEQHHYEQAKVALDELGPTAAVVLRHLEKHGRLIYRQRGQNPPTPGNIVAQKMRAALDRCVSKDLATRSHEWVATGGVTHKIEETTYQIAPGMKVALDELLYPESREN
jgi:hypothetical protein